MRITVQIKKAFEFFIQKEQANEVFTKDELEQQTGWKRSTIESYLTKKWNKFVFTTGEGKYRVKGMQGLSIAEFAKLHSQKAQILLRPSEPEFSQKVENLIIKSRESALQAVQIYNNPLSMFRSHGFIVFMIIAWTSIFHAYFENQDKNYFYDGITIDGKGKAWEIRKCLREYYALNNCAKKANLEFLTGLRDEIEHQYLPAIDWEVAGRCQATLINYESFLVEHFGDSYALNETLAFSLQFSRTQQQEKLDAKKKIQSIEYKKIRNFIKEYDSTLPEDILLKTEYNFRVYLIPILGNHAKSADYCVEFIKYDPDNIEEMERYEKDIALIKSRVVQATNVGKYRPSKVAELVAAGIEKTFRVYPEHVKAWKLYKVRPHEKRPEGCNPKYCQFDLAYKEFVYTQGWVDFLIHQLKNEDEYQRLIDYKIN